MEDDFSTNNEKNGRPTSKVGFFIRFKKEAH